MEKEMMADSVAWFVVGLALVHAPCEGTCSLYSVDNGDKRLGHTS